MTVNEQVDVFGLRELVRSDASQTLALIFCAVGSARVRATLREAGRPIGVQHPKRLDCVSVAHDRTNHSVSAIFFVSQAVTMLDPGLPAGDGAFPWANDVRHADILPKNLAAPTVVVPGYPEHVHSSICKVRERSKRAEAPSWDDCLPFEPEIEEIAVYHERSSDTGEIPQESDKRPFDLAACDSEMRVRNDVARRFEHGTS